MGLPSLFQLFQHISKYQIISICKLPDELQRLLQRALATDRRAGLRAVRDPSSILLAQDRVHHWARKNGISNGSRKYSRAACENIRQRPKSEWEDEIRMKLVRGLELDARGELLAAAEIGKEVDREARREETLFTRIAKLTARRLITDAGEVMSFEAPARIRAKLRQITKQYYGLGELTLCASSCLTEAMHVRTQAIVYGHRALLEESIRLAEQAQNFLVAGALWSKPADFQFRYRQVLYVQSRILTDAGERQRAATKLSTLIDLAALTQTGQPWIDPLRGVFSHFNCLGDHYAAEIALASLCYYFDQVSEPSVFTFFSILLRLMQHAAVTDRYFRKLDELFFRYWHDYPQAYFWARYCEVFEQLKLGISKEKWLDIVHPVHFASRCASSAKDPRLVP